MVTLSLGQVSALDSLSGLTPGPRARAMERSAKLARRAKRDLRFNRSIRDGLRYSHVCVKAKRKPQGDGGAVSAWRIDRIIP